MNRNMNNNMNVNAFIQPVALRNGTSSTASAPTTAARRPRFTAAVNVRPRSTHRVKHVAPPPPITNFQHLSPSPSSSDTHSDPQTFSYNVRLKTMCRKKHSLSRCLRLLDHMHDNNITPDKYTYCALLTSCVHSNAPEAATDIYRSMVSDGIPLDQYLRCTLLKTMSMSPSPSPQQLDFCLHLFQEATHPNRVLCNVMMDAYAASGNVDKCMTILRYMNGANITPDRYSVSAIVKAYIKAGRINDALDNLANMYKAKLDIPSSAFSLVVSAYGRIGQLDKAFKVHKLMASWRIPPTVASYNNLIRSCAYGGHVQLALQTYDEMKRAYLQPDRYTLHALMQCFLQGNDGMAALQAYTQIFATNFRPNQVSFRLAFQAVALLRDDQWLQKVVSDLQTVKLQHGMQPRQDVLVALVAASVACEQPQIGSELLLQNVDQWCTKRSHGDVDEHVRKFFHLVAVDVRSAHSNDNQTQQLAEQQHTADAIIGDMQRETISHLHSVNETETPSLATVK